MSAYPQAGKASRTARGAVPTSRHYSRHPLPGAATCHQQRCITQRETGDPDVCCGHDSFQVTGDGHGSQPLGSQPFGLQPPESGYQLPMAERPIHELPMPVPVTRHLSRCLSLYSILSHPTFALLHRPQADLHLCTVCLYPLSPCHRAHVSPVGVHPNQYFHTITIAAVSSSQ